MNEHTHTETRTLVVIALAFALWLAVVALLVWARRRAAVVERPAGRVIDFESEQENRRAA